jgi:DNA-binding winged helix-turn-helix (wHTH) protein
MFVTHGPVPPDSRLFVGRVAEMKRFEKWLSHVDCVGAVLGARQTGKTSLLLRLCHAFRDKCGFAFVDLQAVVGAQPAECFNYIAEQMVEQLAETGRSDELSLPKDNRAFSTFLRELARRARAVRLVLILDEIGALPPETALRLAGTIRAAFTDRFLTPEFARYIFLLAGATDMLDLTAGRNSPLGNVTERIYLGDLSLAETEQLLGEGFGSTPPALLPQMNSQLHAWTGGHPYWTQFVAAALENQSQTLTDEPVGNVVEHLLRTEDRNLPHVIRSLKADSGLWELTETLLDGATLPFSRTNAAIAKLELIGVLQEKNGRCSIRNRIYQEGLDRYRRASSHAIHEAAPNLVRFGPFQLDLKAGELCREGRKILLQEQPFQILKMLVEHPGEVVSREEVRQRLWPSGTIVEFDHSINTAIKNLRLALFDSAEKPRYVETVARRGYRLIVPVE